MSVMVVLGEVFLSLITEFSTVKIIEAYAATNPSCCAGVSMTGLRLVVSVRGPRGSGSSGWFLIALIAAHAACLAMSCVDDCIEEVTSDFICSS